MQLRCEPSVDTFVRTLTLSHGDVAVRLAAKKDDRLPLMLIPDTKPQCLNLFKNLDRVTTS